LFLEIYQSHNRCLYQWYFKSSKGGVGWCRMEFQWEVYENWKLGSHKSQKSQLVRSIANFFFFQFYIYEFSMQLSFLELVMFLYFVDWSCFVHTKAKCFLSRASFNPPWILCLYLSFVKPNQAFRIIPHC